MQLVNGCLIKMGRIDKNNNEIPKEKREENCEWKNYNPEIDIVCIIFDMDSRGLMDIINQIFEKCDKNGIMVVPSKPNFELWLLMHLTDISKFPEEQLLNNHKNLRHQLFEDASTKKKYLEILVSKEADGYSKGSKIKFEKFLPHIDEAIVQAGKYSENSKELVDKLGTSVGKLIKEMRNI